jgi:hypothetical protein
VVLAHLHVGRVDPEIGPLPLDGPLQEGVHPFVDLLAQPADLALGDARPAHGLNEIIDRPGGDTLDVGLLDHRRERLLGHPAWLQEAREVAPRPQLRDAQFDRAGPRLPIPVAVPVALGQPLRVLLAVGRAGQAAHLQFHQTLRGKTNHLAQHVRVSALLSQRPQAHNGIGHRGSPGFGVGARNPILTRHRRWPPPREIPPATALWRARRRNLPLSFSYTTPRDTTPRRPEKGRKRRSKAG